MLILGADTLANWLASSTPFTGKAVFNESGAIFFSAMRQHREMKAEGISYEDDYKGNALAAMLAPGSFEIRFHKAFPDGTVARIVAALVVQTELIALRGWRVTYQGRELLIPGVE